MEAPRIGNNFGSAASLSAGRASALQLGGGRGSSPSLQLAQAAPSARLAPVSTRASDLRPLTPPSSLPTRAAPQITVPRGTISLPPAAPAPSTTIRLPIIGNVDVGAAAARFAAPRIQQQNTREGLPIDQPGFQQPRTPTFAPVQLPSYTAPATNFRLNPSFNAGGLFNRTQPVVQARPELNLRLSPSAGINVNTNVGASLNGGVRVGPVNGGLTFGIGKPDSQGVRPVGNLGVQFNNPQAPGLNFTGGVSLPINRNNGTLDFGAGINTNTGAFSIQGGLNLRF